MYVHQRQTHLHPIACNIEDICRYHVQHKHMIKITCFIMHTVYIQRAQIHLYLYSMMNVMNKILRGGWNPTAPMSSKRPKWFGPTFTANYKPEVGTCTCSVR